MPSASPDIANSGRRRLIALVATVAVLGSSALAVTVATSPRSGDTAGRMSALDCPRGTTALIGADPAGPISCVHSDQPPPGVDVTKPVSTEELLSRDGAAATAIAAAQEAGVPTPSTVAAQTPGTVACDGDGSTGYRVQAVYAYDPAKAAGTVGGDRFSSLETKLQEWAAGVDTVFNRSAALTGGYRSVRWVTAPDGSGGCRPTVIKVPMSTAVLTSYGLNDMVAAMESAGYNAANRKYLIWAEANELCGIANLYGNGAAGGRYSTPNQDNYNNGYAAMYTRVDTACWGRANSTEAHELTHNLGGVLNTSPNHSAAGHCTDDSDIMCYSDGAGVVMRTVCPADNEFLLDCNGNDYFSTRPKAGSWLTTNWNTANSRWLIGGGDGTNAGTVGTTRSDVSANPGVAGLPTQASTTLTAPAGRTHTTTWSTQTPRCDVVGSGDQASLRCAPGVTTGSLTAITSDSAGVSTRDTAEVPFDQALRAATVSIAGPADACAAGPVAVTSKVLDRATGLGVYGANVQFIASGGAVIGTAVTDTTGTATGVAYPTGATTITARVADAMYAGATPSGSVAVATECAVTSLTGYLENSTVPAGDQLVVRGSASNSRGPAAGAAVTVKLGAATVTTTTNSYGYWNATFPSLDTSGPVTASSGSVSNQPVGTVTMQPWTTYMSMTNSGAKAGSGATLTGQVVRDNPSTGARVNAAGVRVVVRSGTWSAVTSTGTDGRFTTSTAPLTAATTFTATVEATPQMTAATTSTTVAVSASYSSNVTLAAPASTWAQSPVTLSGTLSLTSLAGTAASPASRTVTISVTSGGATRTYSAVTGSTGAYSVTVPALSSDATATASFAGVGSHPAATSAPVSISIKPLTYTTALTLTAPASVASGTAALVSGQLLVTASNGATTPATGAVVKVQAAAGSATPVTYPATVNAAGAWSASLPVLTVGTSVSATFEGTSAWPSATSGTAKFIDVYTPTYTSSVSLTSVPASAGYGQAVTVGGSLTFASTIGAPPAVTGQRVRVVFTPSGLAPVTVYATAASTGAWTAKSPALTRPTAVSVFFDQAGAIQAAPAVAPRTVAVGNFTALPVVSSSTAKLYGAGTAAVTGTVYKAHGATKLTHPGARVTVKVYDAAGAYRAAATVSADSYGRFTARVPVYYSGTLRTAVAAVTGVNAGTAPNRGITVVFKASLGLSTRSTYYGRYLTASTQVSPVRAGRPVYLQRYYKGKWSTVSIPKTDRYGRAKVSVKQTLRGTLYYRWYVPGDKYNASAYSGQLSVSVR